MLRIGMKDIRLDCRVGGCRNGLRNGLLREFAIGLRQIEECPIANPQIGRNRYGTNQTYTDVIGLTILRRLNNGSSAGDSPAPSMQEARMRMERLLVLCLVHYITNLRRGHIDQCGTAAALDRYFTVAKGQIARRYRSRVIGNLFGKHNEGVMRAKFFDL